MYKNIKGTLRPTTKHPGRLELFVQSHHETYKGLISSLTFVLYSISHTEAVLHSLFHQHPLIGQIRQNLMEVNLPYLHFIIEKVILFEMIIKNFQDWKRRLISQEWMKILLIRMNIASNMRTPNKIMIPGMNKWRKTISKMSRKTMQHMNPIKKYHY